MRLFRTQFIIIFALFLLCCPQGQGADDAKTDKTNQNSLCSMLLGDANAEPSLEDFLKPRPGFIHNAEDYRHNKALGCNLDVRDQKNFGSCWAHASLRIFELRALKNTGYHTPLSADYLMAMHLLENAMRTIIEPDHQFAEGASPAALLSLSYKYGFIPEKVWRPRIAITNSRGVIRKLLFHLRVKINQAQSDFENLPPGDDVNQKFFIQTRIELLHIIEAFTGEIPQIFEFEGRLFTPLEFYKQSRYRAANQNTSISIERHYIDRKMNNALNIFHRIKNQIDKTGEPVNVYIRWEPTFIDSSTGVASIAAFNPYPTPTDLHLQQITRLVSQAADADGGDHSVLIVDYSLNEKGMPTKLLALNSYGSHYGDGGYNHIYWDYFESFLNGAYLLQGF